MRPKPKELSRPALPMSSLIWPELSRLSTWAGVIAGLAARIRASTPATWGEAIEVPCRKP